jgi:hypothetical protein
VTLDFQLAAYLTGIVLFVAAFLAYATTRDTLHPMIYLGAMAFFLHAFLPLYFDMTQPDELRSYLGQDELDYAQTIAFLGILSLAGGVWWGAHGALSRAHAPPVGLSCAARVRLVRAAVALVTLGLISWIYQIIYSGGLYAVYGHPYGWFGADSGYVNETFQFGLPGVLLLLLARSGGRLRHWDLVWIGAAVLGGLALGLLLLFLLANRNHIYLGSDFAFTGAGAAHTFEVEPGNEFVFGAGAALNTDALNSFTWGRRYFVILFVRPVPRSLWPTKYADAARFLNIPNLDHLDKDPQLTDFSSTIGWSGAIGSAPGGIFDLWNEFWWAYLFAVLAIGWGFGVAYRKAVSQGGFWMALYALVTALSIFFVMQDWSAFAFRALLLGAVTWLGWRYAMGSGVLARTDGTRPRAGLPRTA